VGRTVRCPACGNSFDATRFRSDADQDSDDLASARSMDGSDPLQQSQHRTGGLTPVRSPSIDGSHSSQQSQGSGDTASRDARSGETFTNEGDEGTVGGASPRRGDWVVSNFADYWVRAHLEKFTWLMIPNWNAKSL